jgi:hypothetical protein
MEKLQSRKVVGREAGEGSNSHDWVATTKDERIKMFMEAGAQMKEVEALGTDRPPAKIQKVIFLLRDDEKCFVRYFEPRVASLGPIHHGKPKYQLGEKYKLRLAYEFVECCSKHKSNNLYEGINSLYEKIKEEIKELRECFEEEVTKKYDDEELAWMLFVDGCAILQYIFCAANSKFKNFNIKTDSVTFAQQDLFLLENQVPYLLLKLLMSLSEEKEELNKSIESFIQKDIYQQTKRQRKKEVRCLLQPKSKECHEVSIEGEPTHLLDLLRTRLLGDRLTFSEKTCRWPCRKIRVEGPDLQSYRNVQELKAAGIQLKRGKNSYLRNISFTRQFGFYPGYLWLPPITVDDSTGPKFMNLIAYEMCLDFENDFGITSYISFLDSLIDEPNDVKELRKARVLYNLLGSDQEVADLFNRIGTDLVPNDEAYKEVKLQIQGYYDNNWMTWMAQLFHNHFSSPWAIIALFGILFGLGLSTIQTWYSVNSPPGPCDDFCKKLP